MRLEFWQFDLSHLKPVPYIAPPPTQRLLKIVGSTPTAFWGLLFPWLPNIYLGITKPIRTLQNLKYGKNSREPRERLPLSDPELFKSSKYDDRISIPNAIFTCSVTFPQVSPIQENIVVQNRPWWERYQPISYQWITRSGSVQEFIEMVKRCNNAGVRIYVDLIMNHMTSNRKPAIGTGRSTADTYKLRYDAVPYNVTHFHPSCRINNYNDATNVRNCELSGLHDLDQGLEHVRGEIVDLMNEAIKMGVAGFRFVYLNI